MEATPCHARGVASIKRSERDTLDDPQAPARAGVTREDNAPTHYVKPYRDHSVEQPMHRPPSASQMAAKAPPIADGEGGVQGVMVQAAFDRGDFVVRLSNATASERALAQLLSAKGLEVEIVVRRRAP